MKEGGGGGLGGRKKGRKDGGKDDGKALEKINHAQSLGDHWTA